MSRRLTTEEFVEKAVKIHGDKYDYSKVEYIKNSEKVIIICPEHGDFEQTPNIHLRGSGCNICGCKSTGENKKKFHQSQRDWNFEQPEEYKLIPLTQGKYAKVDNEDFERLKDINWQLTSKGYATSKEVGRMHRFIMNCPEGMVVDHKEHDKLDNRKSNLRLATKRKLS